MSERPAGHSTNQNPDDAQRHALRQTLRQRRRSLSADQQRLAAQNLLQQLREGYQVHLANRPMARIAGYRASRDEINPAPALEWLRQNGSQTFLPVIKTLNAQSILMFAPYNNNSEFVTGACSIQIPVVDETSLIAADKLDLVLVPLTGFDTCGGRLGTGGGFYDRSFAYRLKQNTQQQFIGVAHDCQKVERVPLKQWDVPLDAVVTDQNWYHCRKSG